MWFWVALVGMLMNATQAKLYNATTVAPGKAVVVNGCDYVVYLRNVPAAGGGFCEVVRMLQPNGSYEQHFTPLTNGQGWSIKMSKDNNFSSNDILQYEYTWHRRVSPQTIWFDLSEVNGNPWPGEYDITAVGDECTPRQAAYRFPTDDAYGMQTCPSYANITVTLCSTRRRHSEDRICL